MKEASTHTDIRSFELIDSYLRSIGYTDAEIADVCLDISVSLMLENSESRSDEFEHQVQSLKFRIIDSFESMVTSVDSS